ncbi:MAG: hypothetical protein PUB18_01740, partial [bacterium]|nr:hypothetical protein [bacterium]
MIKFFRDVLDGPVYIIIVVISVILIIGIIGFIWEKKKGNKKSKIQNTISVEPTKTREVVLSTKENSALDEKELNFVSTSSLHQQGRQIIDSLNVKVGEISSVEEGAKVQNNMNVVGFGGLEDIKNETLPDMSIERPRPVVTPTAEIHEVVESNIEKPKIALPQSIDMEKPIVDQPKTEIDLGKVEKVKSDEVEDKALPDMSIE